MAYTRPRYNVDDDEDASVEVSDGGKLRRDLEGVLKGAFDFKGKIAFKETPTLAPVPGLHIEGIGVIGFPLAERDAKLIEVVATQAPFGKRAKTVVDKTVRNTLELNPEKFSFKNPAWAEFLQTVIKKVACGLGLPPNLPPPRADLHKLLLYKTGSHFLPHKDTEKSQGMFASLVIVLPSKFEGGEVHVSHGDEKEAFDISPSSQFTTSALAWYTGAIHEIKPVTSGYRLAVSYNLVNTSPNFPSPHLPDIHSAVSAVGDIFRKWKEGVYNEPNFSGNIAYLLTHHYSHDSLEFTTLKGKDATLISNIRGVAESQGISLRLGLLECTMNGEAYTYGIRCGSEPAPKMQRVHDTRYRIKGLYDSEGDLAEGTITLRPSFDLIPQNPGFKGQDPDDEESEGYTENRCALLKYRYRRAALVMSLAGKDSKTQLNMGGTRYALKKLQRWKPEGQTERNKQMAQILLDGGHFNNHWSRELTEDAAFLVDLALEWGDFAMWQKVLEKSSSSKSAPKLSTEVLVRASSVFTLDRIKILIEQTIGNKSDTKKAIEFITDFRARAPTQDPNVVAWWKQQTTTVLSSIKSEPSVDDVQMFVDVANSEGIIFFSTTIVKQLVGFRQLFNFWVGLAEGLWKNKDKLIPSGGTPEETSKYTSALSHTINCLIGAAVLNYSSGASDSLYHSYTFAHMTPRDPTSRILQLLDLMALTGGTHHSGQLIASVTKLKGDLLAEYQNFVTPLIPKLKARYQQHKSSAFPMLDALLRGFAERWLQDLLGTPSARPQAIVKKLVCTCQDCAIINKFLQSNAVRETLRVPQKRRLHVQDSIGCSISDAVTLTTITSGSPHGLQVTKTDATSTMDKWDGRVKNARAFLSLVGTPDSLVRIMGDRYQDVQSALAGTKPYKINKPVPVVAPVKNTPVASTSAAQAPPVIAGTKRKAEDDGNVVDLTQD